MNIITRQERCKAVRDFTINETVIKLLNIQYTSIQHKLIDRGYISIDIINMLPDYQWDWDYITQHSNIPLRDILNNPDNPWDWNCISRHPKLQIQDVLNKPDKPWNWNYISSHRNITLQDVLNNPNKPWDWSYISRNRNITLQDIFNNPDKPWNWNYISQNLPVTLQDVFNHPDKPWDLSCFVDKIDKKFMEYNYRKHLAAYKIQLRWFHVRTNPTYLLCRKKLERDYNKYFG